MSTVIWVALGGASESAARYGLAGAVNYRSHPWGTVVVNILGALVLGVLVGLWGFRADSDIRVGVAVGLLGGFTTFSTFAVDSILLWEHGHGLEAVEHRHHPRGGHRRSRCRCRHRAVGDGLGQLRRILISG